MRSLFILLTRRQRLLLLAVLASTLITALVEVLGIGSLGLFVTVAANPDAAFQSPYAWLLADLGIRSDRELILAVGGVVLGSVVLRNVLSAGATWLRLWFLHMTKMTLQTRILRAYMAQPFPFFLRVNSATVARNVVVETTNLVTGVIYSWIMIFADIAMGGAIVAFMLWHDAVSTVIAAGMLGVVGIALGKGLQRRMTEMGRSSRNLWDQIIKTTNEAFGGIKEIKILGAEDFFVRRFAGHAEAQSRVTILHMLMRELPRYILEILVMVAVAVFVLTRQDQGFAAMAGTLTVFAASIYRLMPTVQRMLGSVMGLQFNQGIVTEMTELLGSAKPDALQPPQRSEALPFTREVALRDIRFRYADQDRDVLDGITVDIPRSTSVAFVGPSGVGKSTLIDILLGLLKPQSGQVVVDGQGLTDQNVRAWQQNIGYVAQQIYLVDDTLRRNIAVGVNDEEVDEERLAAALRMATLDTFVRQLPHGISTVVGERGVRLSGGQRQRVGIARALYRGASILVLDEATSSLDGITEAEIEEALRSLAGRITLVMIAHRLTTVRACDVIHMMDAGRIVASGTYDALMRDNQAFRAMARHAG